VKHILIGFSIHRPEMILKTSELMAAHDVIFLEEPPDPEFHAMLKRTISIESYLMSQDLEYPAFSLRSMWKRGPFIFFCLKNSIA
jgi:hypothetical protein